MNNFMVLFGIAVAVAEIIIEATKNTIAKKYDNTLYSTIILGICGLIAIVIDMIYNQPVISGLYIFEALCLLICTLLVLQLSYDKVIEIINILKKIKK